MKSELIEIWFLDPELGKCLVLLETLERKLSERLGKGCLLRLLLCSGHDLIFCAFVLFNMRYFEVRENVLN